MSTPTPREVGSVWNRPFKCAYLPVQSNIYSLLLKTLNLFHTNIKNKTSIFFFRLFPPIIYHIMAEKNPSLIKTCDVFLFVFN